LRSPQPDFEDGGRLLVPNGSQNLELGPVWRRLGAGRLKVYRSGGVGWEDGPREKEDDDVVELWKGGKGEGEFGRLDVGLRVDSRDVGETRPPRNDHGEHAGGMPRREYNSLSTNIEWRGRYAQYNRQITSILESVEAVKLLDEPFHIKRS
jgi:hypothetical protein